MRPVSLFLLIGVLVAIRTPCIAQSDLGGERIYQAVSGAVVQVQAMDERGQLLGTASAIVLKDRKWLVTNCHVFARGGELLAKKNKDYLQLGDIIRADSKRDILIVSILPDHDVPLWESIPALTIVPRDSLHIGQHIYAIGNPLGLETTITDGLISGLRSSDVSDNRFIQISAPISHGSSGGGVFDDSGRLIGMTTFIYGDESAQNLNFAIPLSQVVEWNKDSTRMDIAQYKPDPHFAKAIDLWHDKQFLKAHIEFSIVPDNAGEQRAMAAYYNARCLEILKQTGEAEVWYEGALERDPQLARAYLGLARLQVARGDMVKGFTNQMRAYELDPRLRDVDYALGD